jgi:hypothetical protein
MEHDPVYFKIPAAIPLRKVLLADQGREAPGVAYGVRYSGLHRNHAPAMAEVIGNCEFPKPNGKEICGQPATEVVTFHGLRWSYQAKACAKCAEYVEKEARTNVQAIHGNKQMG